MIDNAYKLEDIADFMGVEVKSLKAMRQKGALPFPLTPITSGRQRFYCVFKEHWNASIEKQAAEALKEFEADMEALKSKRS